MRFFGNDLQYVFRNDDVAKRCKANDRLATRHANATTLASLWRRRFHDYSRYAGVQGGTGMSPCQG